MPGLGRRHFLSMLAASAGLSGAGSLQAKPPDPRQFLLEDSGAFPNSRFPALYYAKALPVRADLADQLEELFERNGWTGSWRNGLFSFHHYHSTAHEVLGVYSGSVRVRLGGDAGPLVTLNAGDVAVLPAGVAHKNEAQSPDFRVVGAYPRGTSADMQYGKPKERPGTDHKIRAVPLPGADPVLGRDGPLGRLWHA